MSLTYFNLRVCLLGFQIVLCVTPIVCFKKGMENVPLWIEEKIRARYPHEVQFLKGFTQWLLSELKLLDLYEESNVDPELELRLLEKMRGLTFVQVESILVKEALIEHKGNITSAAKLLGISRSAMYMTISRLNLNTFLLSIRGPSLEVPVDLDAP